MAVEIDEDELIEYWTLAGEELGQAWQGCALQSICPGDTGFRHPQVQSHNRGQVRGWPAKCTCPPLQHQAPL